MLFVDVDDFARELRTFTTFVGYSEIQNRIQRVAQKFGGLRAESEELRRRFAFLGTLAEFYSRRQSSRSIVLRSPFEIQTASSVAVANRIAASISDPARARFRSSLLDGMNPDRDFRHIEHELRVYTHFRQKGFSVLCADLEGVGRYDLLVTTPREQFEVECKAVSGDTGSLITIEKALEYFEGLRPAVLDTERRFASAIVDVRFGNLVPTTVLQRAVADHFLRGQDGSDDEQLLIKSEPRPEWQPIRGGYIPPALLLDIAASREQSNPHSLTVSDRRGTVLVNLYSRRSSRLLHRVTRIAKEATTQLSGNRPGVVWLHFLALSESGFRLLAQQSQESGRAAFARVANHVFRSDSRQHVAKLLFSADANSVSIDPTQLPVTRDMSLSGPVYDMTNLRCKFKLLGDF